MMDRTGWVRTSFSGPIFDLRICSYWKHSGAGLQLTGGGAVRIASPFKLAQYQFVPTVWLKDSGGIENPWFLEARPAIRRRPDFFSQNAPRLPSRQTNRWKAVKTEVSNASPHRHFRQYSSPRSE